jgi:hypothetical protein
MAYIVRTRIHLKRTWCEFALEEPLLTSLPSTSAVDNISREFRLTRFKPSQILKVDLL